MLGNPPSSLPGITFNFHGFADEAARDLLAANMLYIVREVGREIDISKLDGVTVSTDYDRALINLDRGSSDLPPESKTNEGGLIGIAKAILVRRGGEIKTHLVFDAGPLLSIASESPLEDDIQFALSLIAHECAHVAEHTWRERRFPGSLLRDVEGFMPKQISQFSETLWCEYFVCRTSAQFARCEESRYRRALSARLERARRVARGALIDYRFYHGDIDRVYCEVGRAVIEPLRMASYLFGNLDGLAHHDLPDVVSEIPTSENIFLSEIPNLVGHLRHLWETRNIWESFNSIEILSGTVFQVLRRSGLDVRPLENGTAFIDAPSVSEMFPREPSFLEIATRALQTNS